MYQPYEDIVITEMQAWQQDMQRKPGIGDKLSRNLQKRINNIIPEKVHQAITVAFREMVGAVLSGSALC